MHPYLKLHKNKFRLSLKFKLLGVLIPISILPILLASFGWYETMIRSSMNHSADITSQYTQLVAENISQYTGDISQALDPLLIDLNFQKFIKTPKADMVSQARYALEFRPILQSFMQSHKELLGVLYMDLHGKILYQSYQRSMNYIYPFENDPFFAHISEVRKTVLSTAHTTRYVLGQQEESLSIIRPVIDLSNGQIYGWLIADIRADYFRQLMKGASPDKDGQILLYHPLSGATVTNQKMDDKLLEHLRGAVARNNPADPEFTLISQHVSYQAVLEDLDFGDWKLIWVTPLDAITSGVRQSLQWTLLIAVSALLLCCLIAFPTMRIVLKPMDRLVGGMRNLSRGKYEPVAQPAGKDEISFLVKTYNQMLVELEQMEREVYQAQLKEREKEVLQLQAQTNPHFFFNMLETIESYAILNNGNAVSDMVQSVSRMMRYNVRNDAGWAPLSEEMAFIQDFLNIHRHRNGLSIETEWDIDSSLLELPIMRLSIQPFVENALKYGWSPALSEGEFKLKITIERMGSAIRFLILNTGIGMDPKVLEMIRQLLEQGVDGASPYFKQHTGIYNVYRRLVLVYGSRVRVRFFSGTPGGTKVDIMIADEAGASGS
ncbi:sensor histidine kinase [Paenibacillus sepulcri]|uniref:Histidine kinase n=1 Tax=Paenibacillus sepulcri TaxID=359917 RepID=A0ABS7C7Y2_9BACL|nr:histidine kinase [Paenibacillus sepulcri]